MLCGGAVVWVRVLCCSGPGGCLVVRELPEAVVSPCCLSRVRWRRRRRRDGLVLSCAGLVAFSPLSGANGCLVRLLGGRC